MRYPLAAVGVGYIGPNCGFELADLVFGDGVRLALVGDLPLEALNLLLLAVGLLLAGIALGGGFGEEPDRSKP